MKTSTDGLFVRTYKRTIVEAKSGVAKGIPFTSSKWTKAVSGITRATYYLILAGSNVGKTRISMDLFWLQPLEFTFNNTDLGIDDRKEGDVRVMFYSLEMTLNRLLAIIVARRIKFTKGLDISKELGLEDGLSDRSIMGIEGIPSEALLKYMEDPEIMDYLNRLNKHTDFKMSDSIDKMLATIEEFCLDPSISKIIDYDSDGEPIYEFINKYFMLIVMLDHISNVDSSSGVISRDIIKKASNGFARLKNMFGVTFVILQQANPGEDVFIPGHGDVRDGKDTFIDADVVIGLANPYKLGYHEMAYGDHMYYIIPNAHNGNRGLMNSIRYMGTEKVRYNDLTAQAPFGFDGAVSRVYDLPPPLEVDYTEYSDAQILTPLPTTDKPKYKIKK